MRCFPFLIFLCLFFFRLLLFLLVLYLISSPIWVASLHFCISRCCCMHHPGVREFANIVCKYYICIVFAYCSIRDAGCIHAGWMQPSMFRNNNTLYVIYYIPVYLPSLSSISYFFLCSAALCCIVSLYTCIPASLHPFFL
jgi:hypothetical protein